MNKLQQAYCTGAACSLQNLCALAGAAWRLQLLQSQLGTSSLQQEALQQAVRSRLTPPGCQSMLQEQQTQSSRSMLALQNSRKGRVLQTLQKILHKQQLLLIGWHSLILMLT